MKLGNFPTLLLCVLFLSIIFACVFESTAKERAHAVLRHFIILAVASVVIGWLMYFFTR